MPTKTRAASRRPPAPPRPRLRPTVEIVRQETAPAFIGSHKNVILFIHGGSKTFNTNIGDYFHRKPEPWFLGSINQSESPDGWASKYVGGVWPDGSVSVQPRAPEGYYLFQGGQPVAFHSGTAPVPGQTPLQFDSPTATFLWGVLSHMADAQRDFTQGARDAIEQFELILNRLPQSSPPGSRQPSPPTRRSPYEILGIAKTASMDEASKAWKQGRKLFDPSRVDGMAEELKRVAHERSVELNNAWDEVKAEKGW